ncbi:hypothetical protein CK203_008579 [Vitis vinifera]|uniref:Reverse transcriptase zinc-binding domain-containing protein n=1 Tax=Vitis vinifera TaxID=29760 RepID=A0A438KDA6_VITVI|nr:hypothetical protein CK203_008579 [Vitis vinifera]
MGKRVFGWRPNKANGAVGVEVWKEIWKESKWCWDNMMFRVGKGNTIRFWTDVWCSDSALSHCFPHLFGMAVQRNSTVEEMWEQIRARRSGQFKVKEAYRLLAKSNDTVFPQEAFGWQGCQLKLHSSRGRRCGEVDVKWVFPEIVKERGLERLHDVVSPDDDDNDDDDGDDVLIKLMRLRAYKYRDMLEKVQGQLMAPKKA